MKLKDLRIELWEHSKSSDQLYHFWLKASDLYIVVAIIYFCGFIKVEFLWTTLFVHCSGYMAPEYAMHGQFSVKSDVFSFGVLVLEILSGQKNHSFRNGDDVGDLTSFVSCINAHRVHASTSYTECIQLAYLITFII